MGDRRGETVNMSPSGKPRGGCFRGIRGVGRGREATDADTGGIGAAMMSTIPSRLSLWAGPEGSDQATPSHGR